MNPPDMRSLKLVSFSLIRVRRIVTNVSLIQIIPSRTTRQSSMRTKATWCETEVHQSVTVWWQCADYMAPGIAAQFA
ncbi:unnamed protein product [Nesidiocoris tenuis]|uniref:Uncharacterized protein n=1 Tax=Nesidiocoris tenuis TaxID=355587 RepID=A0A6H5GK24_9HEMI|nr:unnamed protein product [Nesidiocoris tenuis]CAB0003347.1 unnamed protein product [Nesidiocoris tenuis]